MRRLDPSVILLAHDVAIIAGRRVIRQIRPALSVDERVSADSDREADHCAEDYAFYGA